MAGVRLIEARHDLLVWLHFVWFLAHLICQFRPLLARRLSASAQLQSGEGGIAALFITICLCCVDCFLGLIQWLITYFNHYAYTVVALYGKAYIPAAKDTWSIIPARAELTRSSTTVLLTRSCHWEFCSLPMWRPCLPTCTSATPTRPTIVTAATTPLLLAFTMVIALQIGDIITVAIRAGTATFFVALARDPDVFRLSYPGLYDELLRAYPAVREKLGQAW